MNVIGQHLEEREAAALSERDQEKATEAWLLTGKSEEERLLAFDGWLRRQLRKRLDWKWAGAHEEKRIEQCRLLVEKMVLDLWRRGWLLDGRLLAKRITGMLDDVAKYQRAGKIANFWAYFSTTVNRYVGLNAEELQAEATASGARLGHDLLATLGIGRGGPATAKAAPLPHLVATRADEVVSAKAATLREKLARARSRKKEPEQTLPGF